MAPDEDELPLREQLEQLVDDEVIARRLVHEPAVAGRRRSLVEPLEEAAHLGPVPLRTAVEPLGEVAERPCREGVPVVGVGALVAARVDLRQGDPRLWRRRDAVVRREDALDERRARSRQRQHEDRRDGHRGRPLSTPCSPPPVMKWYTCFGDR
jgi:hypothetical protein